MNILILAPQSFFVERGTPIAVKMLTETLESMEKSKIDLITYHEGQDIKFKKARHYRALIPRWIKNIHPGISLKKLLADVFFSLFVFKHLALQKKKYDFIHAVEESVFIALAVKLITGKKYVYDMDSSIAEQSSDKWVFLKLIQFLLNFLENLAIKNARGVLPMCDALAKKAKLAGAKNVTTLRDISYYNDNAVITPDKNLRKTLNLKESDLLILYIGNLEYYQGIDLLMKSFALIKRDSAELVIIGGRQKHIRHHKHKAKHLKIHSNTHFLGSRPLADLSIYLKQADILASPRIKGENTSMKVYSYLHSGKVVIATNLPTNTQAMDSNTAQLTKPDKKDFAEKLEELIFNPELRTKLGNNARKLAKEKYTLKTYKKTLLDFYYKDMPKIS